MKKGFTPVLVLVIILILGGIGFVAYKNINSQKIVTSVTISNPDPNTNWKTYQNKQYNFRLSLPLDWEVRENNNIINQLEIAPGSFKQGFYATIDVDDKEVETVVKNILKMKSDHNNYLIETHADELKTTLTSNTQEDFKGYKATKLIFGSNSGKQEYDIFSFEGKTLVLFRCLYTNNHECQIADQILSTFEFLGKDKSENISLSTSTKLKTFTHSSTGISFSFPVNYTLNEKDDYISIISPILNNNTNFQLQDGELKMEIYIGSSPEKDTLQNFFEEEKNNSQSTILGEGETIIDGKQAKYLKWEGMGDGVLYLLLHNSKRFQIVKYPLKTSRDQEFTKILSSIQFTK